MKKIIVTLVSGAALVSSALSAEHAFKVLHVKDLMSLMEDSAQKIYLFDVNVESTRSNIGIIPGASLLSSSSGFSPEKELPKKKDASLVFYCANTFCTASHAAAKRAVSFGYSNVSVLVDGIYGWKKAEGPIERISKDPQELAPKSVSKLSKLNAVVIVDVREDEERHEVVPQSTWMPMSRVQDSGQWLKFIEALPKEKLVIFHCAHGVRAKKAALMLAREGFKTGFFQGPDQWREAGLPTLKGSAK